MHTHEITFLKHETIAEGTMAFHFHKPDGFRYKAGQSVDMTLIAPAETDASGNTRAFSLVSAPFENQLQVATRLRDSAFKRTLRTLPAGGKVKIDGPFGSMTLHNRVERPALFLAGGIGITPFMSMLRQAGKDQAPHRLYLFYANRRSEDAPFLDELRQLEKANTNFTFVPTMTEADKSRQPWQGETGYIRRELIAKHITDLSAPVCYVAGPPAMVAAMRGMLNGAGVDDDDIRSEEFAGY